MTNSAAEQPQQIAQANADPTNRRARFRLALWLMRRPGFCCCCWCVSRIDARATRRILRIVRAARNRRLF